MNEREYYNRQNDDWTEKEIQDIRTEYETNEMTISQIADIHRRTPGSISYKLKTLGLITNNTQARGYLEYKNSNLYKEIANKENKQIKKSSTKRMSANREMLEMRTEIAELKQDVKELLRLMNALYEFENS
jgi:hypothetical protein